MLRKQYSIYSEFSFLLGAAVRCCRRSLKLCIWCALCRCGVADMRRLLWLRFLLRLLLDSSWCYCGIGFCLLLSVQFHHGFLDGCLQVTVHLATSEDKKGGTLSI